MFFSKFISLVLFPLRILKIFYVYFFLNFKVYSVSAFRHGFPPFFHQDFSTCCRLLYALVWPQFTIYLDLILITFRLRSMHVRSVWSCRPRSRAKSGGVERLHVSLSVTSPPTSTLLPVPISSGTHGHSASTGVTTSR